MAHRSFKLARGTTYGTSLARAALAAAAFAISSPFIVAAFAPLARDGPYIRGLGVEYESHANALDPWADGPAAEFSVTAGLPFTTLRASVVRVIPPATTPPTTSSPGTAPSHGVLLPNLGPQAAGVPRILPLSPDWPGLLNNFTTGFLALLAIDGTASWAVRRTRRRRGQCEYCGYLVRSDARCPECGRLTDPTA